MSYEVILGTFPDDTEKANEQLERYKAVRDELDITEAVAIAKPLEGKDKITWLSSDKKKAARVGAVAGALLGVLGGPATMVVVGLGGAAVGRLISNLTHAGISKQIIETIEDGLEPGSSAIIVIVEADKGHLTLKDLKDLDATIVNQTVESHQVEKIYMIQPSSGISQQN